MTNDQGEAAGMAPQAKPPSGLWRWVNLARLFLVLVPCAPGLIFLLVGFAVDPLWPAQDPTPAMEAAYARSAWQAHQFYLVGGVALIAGTLGMAAVGWKIARTREE